MTYRVRPDGVIETDSLDEAIALADALKARSTAASSNDPAKLNAVLPTDPSANTPEGFIEFFKSLPAPQRTLLRAVRRYSAISLTDLQRVLGIATNNGVAGVISGVTKNARRAGIDPSFVLQSGLVRQHLLQVPACYGGPLLRVTKLPDEEECGDGSPTDTGGEPEAT